MFIWSMANVAIRARMTNAYYSSLLSDLPIFKKFSLKTNKQQTKTKPKQNKKKTLRAGEIAQRYKQTATILTTRVQFIEPIAKWENQLKLSSARIRCGTCYLTLKK